MKPADDGELVHDNLSPTLAWSGVPQRAVELAVLCEDPDAPAAPSATGCSPAWSRPRPAWLKASARPQPSRAATTSARKATAAPFRPRVGGSTVGTWDNRTKDLDRWP